MRVNRGLLGWGVFFIVLGTVPLAVRAGLIPQDTVSELLQLWPLILVGIGLGLVLQRTRLAVLGGLVVAVTFGLMAGALVAGGLGWGLTATACGGSGGAPFTTQEAAFDGEARVTLELDCGELDVRGAAGSGWRVAGTAGDDRAPEVRAGGDRLEVRTPDRPTVIVPSDGTSWEVTLPQAVPVSLDLSLNAGSAQVAADGMTVPDASASVNAGSARLDLSGTTGLERLAASANAGSVVLLLPHPDGTLSASVSVNAGSAEVCIPGDVAVRLTGGDATLGSVDTGDRGLVRSGDTWTSPGYDAATSRVTLDVDVNLGSLALDPEDGCD